MKKIISHILIVSILVCGILNANIPEVQAKTTVDNFDLSKYRADVYLKKGSVCNNIIRNLLKDDTLPSQVIVRDLNSKGYKKSVAKWEAAHWIDKSPYEIAQGEIDKKGYYEAILLSIFISESKMDNSLWDMGKTVTAETNQILSITKSWVKKSDEIGMKTLEDNQKISKLSGKQKKELKNHMEELFRKKHPTLSKSGDIAEVFNEVFSSMDTVYDAVNKMAYYTNACELSSQTKNLIQLMYQDCPKSNPVMKEALRELKVSLDEFNGGVRAEIQSVAIDQASQILSKLADAGWEKVINANPYVAAFSFGGKIGTKLGDSICNTLFSTDKTIEQYEKMKCLGEFRKLLSSSTQKLEKTYLKKRTSVNAENYFAAIDALFATANLSCKFGIEYADILYKDAALGWAAISKKNYNKFLSDIMSIQKTYADKQKSLVRNYLASLKVDYPTIYKTIILTQSTDNKINENGESNKSKLGNSLTNQFLGSRTVEFENRIYFPIYSKLYSIKKDGTSKRLEYTISEEKTEGGICEFVIYKDYVYARYRGNDGSVLVEFPLNGGKMKTYGYISSLALVGNKLYYSKANPVSEDWYVAMHPTEIRVRNLDTNKDVLVRKGEGDLQASDGKYLYYQIAGDNWDYSFYRCDMNGNNPEKIYYAKNALGNNIVNGNYVYYATEDKSNPIYQVNIKTKKKKKICSNQYMIGSLFVKDHKLYASDSVSGVYKIDLTTGEKKLFFEGKVKSFYGICDKVMIFEQYVESESLENVKIIMSTLDGKERKTLGMYYTP